MILYDNARRRTELRQSLLEANGLCNLVQRYVSLHHHYPELGKTPYEMIDDVIMTECQQSAVAASSTEAIAAPDGALDPALARKVASGPLHVSG